MTLLKPILAAVIMLPTISFAQTDFEKAVKAGEVLVTGFSILKSSADANKKLIVKQFLAFA